MFEMKVLDIGSAEMSYSNKKDEDVIGIDICKAYDEQGKVDIIMDAHKLAFNDKTFDKVTSGCTLICYTKDEALVEAIRVLKNDGLFETRIQTLYLGRMVNGLINNNMIIMNIESLNYDGDELTEVLITAKKGQSNWEGMTTEPQLYDGSEHD